MKLYQHAKVTPSCPAVASPWCQGLLLLHTDTYITDRKEECGIGLEPMHYTEFTIMQANTLALVPTQPCMRIS